MMQISIVIPNFNGLELLQKNLPFLIKAKQNRKNKISEIIIVDDASADDSVKFLKENFKDQVKVIAHKINRGFAATVNTGARTTTSHLICLLNNDVQVTENFLETLNEDFSDKNVFAVSLHEKGFGRALGKFKNGFIVHEGQPESKKTMESFWASGGSAVFRRDIWMDLKGMDEELLPFYWEDIDLSYRAQKRGYKVLWDPMANVIHNHESTYKKLDQKMVMRIRERNHLLFIWKNLTSKRLFHKHLKSLVNRILRHPGYLRIVFMALSKWKVVIERRKIEIKEARVSDEAIFAKFS